MYPAALTRRGTPKHAHGCRLYYIHIYIYIYIYIYPPSVESLEQQSSSILI